METFYQYLEMAELMNAPLDSIDLTSTRNGLEYKFFVDNDDYEVTFSDGGNGFWEVLLFGPQGYDTTNLGKEFQVYKQLILALRKFIQQVNPVGLNFVGHTPKQQKVYDKFYRLYLNKMYTKLPQGNLYVRNDMINKVK